MRDKKRKTGSPQQLPSVAGARHASGSAVVSVDHNRHRGGAGASRLAAGHSDLIQVPGLFAGPRDDDDAASSVLSALSRALPSKFLMGRVLDPPISNIARSHNELFSESWSAVGTDGKKLAQGRVLGSGRRAAAAPIDGSSAPGSSAAASRREAALLPWGLPGGGADDPGLLLGLRHTRATADGADSAGGAEPLHLDAEEIFRLDHVSPSARQRRFEKLRKTVDHDVDQLESVVAALKRFDPNIMRVRSIEEATRAGGMEASMNPASVIGGPNNAAGGGSNGGGPSTKSAGGGLSAAALAKGGKGGAKGGAGEETEEPAEVFIGTRRRFKELEKKVKAFNDYLLNNPEAYANFMAKVEAEQLARNELSRDAVKRNIASAGDIIHCKQQERSEYLRSEERKLSNVAKRREEIRQAEETRKMWIAFQRREAHLVEGMRLERLRSDRLQRYGWATVVTFVRSTALIKRIIDERREYRKEKMLYIHASNVLKRKLMPMFRLQRMAKRDAAVAVLRRNWLSLRLAIRIRARRIAVQRITRALRQMRASRRAVLYMKAYRRKILCIQKFIRMCLLAIKAQCRLLSLQFVRVEGQMRRRELAEEMKKKDETKRMLLREEQTLTSVISRRGGAASRAGPSAGVAGGGRAGTPSGRINEKRLTKTKELTVKERLNLGHFFGSEVPLKIPAEVRALVIRQNWRVRKRAFMKDLEDYGQARLRFEEENRRRDLIDQAAFLLSSKLEGREGSNARSRLTEKAKDRMRKAPRRPQFHHLLPLVVMQALVMGGREEHKKFLSRQENLLRRPRTAAEMEADDDDDL